ncbi:MAG: sulfurtransferase [Gammaproteobacteria bacterium]|nr:sulfurtransferase [Gammaproteobacteria bacterium]
MDLPHIVEPEGLVPLLGSPGLVVVDVSKPESYAAGHLPGAVHLDYARLVRKRDKAGGLLPDEAQIAAVLSALGITPDDHVVAYDDEGGGRASRLIWRLHMIGHAATTLLGGGTPAWTADGHALETRTVQPAPSDYPVVIGAAAGADKDYILARLGRADVVLLDTRSPEEYRGSDVRAARGGHIPGAVNFNWTLAMDADRQQRVRPRAELEAMFAKLGVTRDKEVIAYCQTHHRSSHTYVVLRFLGYDDAKGYAGAWSEWGNDPDTPIETG